MLTNEDLSAQLAALASAVRDAAAVVRRNGELPAAQLAGAFIEAHRLGERLTKLARQLGSNGRRE